jgi:hypothetical protein
MPLPNALEIAWIHAAFAFWSLVNAKWYNLWSSKHEGVLEAAKSGGLDGANRITVIASQ